MGAMRKARQADMVKNLGRIPFCSRKLRLIEYQTKPASRLSTPSVEGRVVQMLRGWKQLGIRQEPRKKVGRWSGARQEPHRQTRPF